MDLWEIELGKKYRDRETGIIGHAVSIGGYDYSTCKVRLQPEAQLVNIRNIEPVEEQDEVIG